MKRRHLIPQTEKIISGKKDQLLQEKIVELTLTLVSLSFWFRGRFRDSCSDPHLCQVLGVNDEQKSKSQALLEPACLTEAV